MIESQHGQKINFGLIGPKRAQGMLNQVRSVIKEHRSVPDFHRNQTNPSYMKLVMLEQALVARLEETATSGATSAGAVATVPGVAPAVNPAQVGMQIAQRKKQLQDQLKSAQEQVRNIQKQISQPNLGMAESRKPISESEVLQAQVVLAAQDLVDQIQKMTEQISEMQFKDLPALTASIKNDPNLGPDVATRYQNESTAALTNLLTAVQAGKVQLETAQGTLTGEAPIVPGTVPDEGEAGLEDPFAGEPGDQEVDAVDVDVDDEEVDVTSALGRERR